MTKQDNTKKILCGLSEERIKEIEIELTKIPLYKASESKSLTDEQRAVMVNQIAKKYEEIFQLAKLDYINDENLIDTPFRVASMYVNELMVGRYTKAPRIEAFPANYYDLEDNRSEFYPEDTVESAKKEVEKIHQRLDEIQEAYYSADKIAANSLLTESEKLITKLEYLEDTFLPVVDTRNMVVKTVDVNSLCSHHLISFVSTDEKDSKALISYVPRLGSDKALLGISKLQRIMDFFGRRPQLQETLNWQVKAFVSLILRSSNVMVSFHNIIHYCEKTRGVESHCGSTSSIEYTGVFKDPTNRKMAFDLAK